jgi:hypothetical protein
MSNENVRKDAAHVSSPANPQDCSDAVDEEYLDKVTGGSASDQFPGFRPAPYKVV